MVALILGHAVAHPATAKDCCIVQKSSASKSADEPLFRNIQDRTSMPPEQRDVLQQLINIPDLNHLRGVLELYLTRNQQLSDDEFATLKELLDITTELSDLEREKSAPEEPLEIDQTEQNKSSEEVVTPQARPQLPKELLFHPLPQLRPM